MSESILIENPKVEIAPDILAEIEKQIHEQGQVVIHCIQETTFPSYIRIWPSTFLYDHHSEHRSELVHAENISYFPDWKPVDQGENYFTLVFAGLPKSCIVFDLIEHCSNQSGAFKALNIKRNKSDVYFVQV